jgi:hypothetical protein
MPESKREIIANVPRLHQYMDRHRLAAVVAHVEAARALGCWPCAWRCAT